MLLAFTGLWKKRRVVVDAMKKDVRMTAAYDENLGAGNLSFPQDGAEILNRGLATNRKSCGRQVQR